MSKTAKKNKKAPKVKAAPAPKPEVEAGSWQESLVKSAALLVKSDKDRKRASATLWDGAKKGIETWLPNSAEDESAEKFSDEVLSLLGKERKGDASKIKTVALAVKNNGLDLDAQPNLSKAYAEARRLTTVAVAHNEEDEAAEEVISNINAPKTASTAEAAAKIVLSKGVDEAARLLLDALGDQNHAAHRSLLRAFTQEVSGRVKAEREAEVNARKEQAEAKRAEREAAAASKAKAKPAAKKASSKVTKKAEPTEAKAKAKPAAKASTAKAATTEKAMVIDGEPASVQSDKATAKPVVKKPGKPIIKKPTPKVPAS